MGHLSLPILPPSCGIHTPQSIHVRENSPMSPQSLHGSVSLLTKGYKALCNTTTFIYLASLLAPLPLLSGLKTVFNQGDSPNVMCIFTWVLFPNPWNSPSSLNSSYCLSLDISYLAPPHGTRPLYSNPIDQHHLYSNPRVFKDTIIFLT